MMNWKIFNNDLHGIPISVFHSYFLLFASPFTFLLFHFSFSFLSLPSPFVHYHVPSFFSLHFPTTLAFCLLQSFPRCIFSSSSFSPAFLSLLVYSSILFNPSSSSFFTNFIFLFFLHQPPSPQAFYSSHTCLLPVYPSSSSSFSFHTSF